MEHRPSADRSATTSEASGRSDGVLDRRFRPARVAGLAALALIVACDGQSPVAEPIGAATSSNVIALSAPPPLLQLRAVDRDTLFVEIELDVLDVGEGSESVMASRDGASDTWTAALTVPTGTPFVLGVTWYDMTDQTRLDLTRSSRSFGAFDDPGETSVTIDFDDFDSEAFDADGDSRSNLQERLAGTDPFDPSSPELQNDPPPPVAEGSIDASNARDLAAFAVQMNVVILADRQISPAAFLERFPGSEEASLVAPESLPGTTARGGGACPLGGSYDQVDTGRSDDFAFGRMLDYDDCATEGGTLSGTHDFGRTGSRETSDDYDLTLRQADGPDGAGDTVLRADYVTGGFSALRFTVTDYSRDTERNPFSVSGSGSRGFEVISEVDAVNVYEMATSIAVVTDVGRVEMQVTIDDLVLDRDAVGPIRGSISLVVREGGRVDISVSDTPGVMNFTRTDGTGRTFSDTIAWSELYDPPR